MINIKELHEMTNEDFDKLLDEFHEDTGCYGAGRLPEPGTRVQAEENHHAMIWKVWCQGRTRGLDVSLVGSDKAANALKKTNTELSNMIERLEYASDHNYRTCTKREHGEKFCLWCDAVDLAEQNE